MTGVAGTFAGSIASGLAAGIGISPEQAANNATPDSKPAFVSHCLLDIPLPNIGSAVFTSSRSIWDILSSSIG